MEKPKRVLVIGLDSAPPELLFNRFLDDMPHLRKIIEHSYYGPMKTTIPAITIPAWMVMATGKTPGELGVYGFRHRKKGTYNDIYIANSTSIREPKVWDYLGEKGYKSIVVGVPPTYPPPKIKGLLVSGFITPDASVQYTNPPELKQEIEHLVGEYIFDVFFRREEKDAVRDEIWEMTEKRFEVLRYLISEKEWDYFHFVEIGLDRIHHAFWRYFDENHHLYEPNSKFKNVIPDYYKLLDREIGKLLELVDLDETAVLIVSDHGIKGMKGAFAVNQWLLEEGLLKIRNPEVLENGPVRFNKLDVDWKNSIAWAWGGYYSRVFINTVGREPQGVIQPSKFYEVRDELAELFRSIRGPNGERWDTKVFYPEDIYPKTRGDAPDMMVYFDDLNWRAIGTVGYETPYQLENDTGPDDAVHSEVGVFALHLPGQDEEHHVHCTIYDVLPTVLKLFGIKGGEFHGRSVI